MPWNGSGVFTRVHNWVNDRDASIDITASRFDAENDDFATGIQACITRDGQTVSPTLTTPAIVTPTISGSPVFTGNPLIEKADPQISIKCADEATENTIIRFQDETNVARALLYRPAGTDKVRLDARDSLGAVQAALELAEAGDISVAAGTFKATSAVLTTPTLTSPTLTSPVINGRAGRGIEYASTPQTLLDISATSSGWTLLDMSAAGGLAAQAVTDGASAYILKLVGNGDHRTDGTTAINEGWVRPTGTAWSSADLDFADLLIFMGHSTGDDAQGYASNSNTVIVPAGTNGDIDYDWQVGSSTFNNFTISLMAYFV